MSAQTAAPPRGSTGRSKVAGSSNRSSPKLASYAPSVGARPTRLPLPLPQAAKPRTRKRHHRGDPGRVSKLERARHYSTDARPRLQPYLQDSPNRAAPAESTMTAQAPSTPAGTNGHAGNRRRTRRRIIPPRHRPPDRPRMGATLPPRMRLRLPTFLDPAEASLRSLQPRGVKALATRRLGAPRVAGRRCWRTWANSSAAGAAGRRPSRNAASCQLPCDDVRITGTANRRSESAKCACETLVDGRSPPEVTSNRR